MTASLRVIEGPLQGTSVPLTETRFIIGRGKDCHYRPNSHSISRHHCALRTLSSGVVTLTDLNSSNGTFVNGRQLCGERHLGHGDEIRVGPVVLRFQATTKSSGSNADMVDVFEWLESESSNDHSSPTRTDMTLPDDLSGQLLAKELSENSSGSAKGKDRSSQNASDKASQLLSRLNKAIRRKKTKT